MAEGSIVKLQDLDGYLCQAQKPLGGVLLLPMIYGLNQAVRTLSQRLAEWGLTTLVWNPYPGHPVIPRDESRQRAAHLNDKTMLAQVGAWMTYMRDVLKLHQVATIGFCLGGRVGLLHASQDRRVAGHLSYYPTIDVPRAPNQELDVLTLSVQARCPVMLIRAGQDSHTAPETYDKLIRVLNIRRNVATAVCNYPDAEHGFMELEHHPGHANETAVRLSWPLAIGFLRGCLSAVPSAPAAHSA